MLTTLGLYQGLCLSKKDWSYRFSSLFLDFVLYVVLPRKQDLIQTCDEGDEMPSSLRRFASEKKKKKKSSTVIT